jgi:PIN domain nuclease of toxin-antitoxin system
MKELFDRFKRINLKDAKDLLLIDTCFFISIFEHKDHLKDFMRLKDKAMTSFNVMELIKVDHKLKHMKHDIRKFLEESKGEEMVIVDVDVHPGNREKEVQFVNSIEPELLRYCKDPSDAVLIATAIKTNSIVLTKDKHHIFNAILENFANKHHIKVFKELKDVL